MQIIRKNTTGYHPATPVVLLICLFLMITISGCAHNNGLILKSNDIVRMNNQSMNKTYVLYAGDRIAIKSFFNDKLNDEVTIRPDGGISLKLIGDITAAGLTPAQLEDLLINKYAEALNSSSETYTLGIGDKIAVKFYYNSSLNDNVTIRPDGKISLQLIGDISAAHLTPAELGSLLTKKYSEHIDSPLVTVIAESFSSPHVSVEVREYVEQKVFIGGEVNKPGVIPVRGTLRTLDALIQAGWFLDSAHLENVIIIRDSGSQNREVYSLNIKKIISGELSDVVLKPFDIVYVPKTAIADLAVFMKQIYSILPSINFPFYYDLNPQDTVRVEQQ